MPVQNKLTAKLMMQNKLTVIRNNQLWQGEIKIKFLLFKEMERADQKTIYWKKTKILDNFYFETFYITSHHFENSCWINAAKLKFVAT